MPTIQVTDQAVVINGRSKTLDKALMACAHPYEEPVRGIIIFVLCCLGPIAAMVTATLIHDPLALRLAVSLALSVGAVTLGCILGIYWKKPWSVVLEEDLLGYNPIYVTASKDEAERIAKEINVAIEKRGKLPQQTH